MYPDQSLYPCNSVPALVERINNALTRADQIEHAEGNVKVPHTLFLHSMTICHTLCTSLCDPPPLLHALIRVSMLSVRSRESVFGAASTKTTVRVLP